MTQNERKDPAEDRPDGAAAPPERYRDGNAPSAERSEEKDAAPGGEARAPRAGTEGGGTAREDVQGSAVPRDDQADEAEDGDAPARAVETIGADPAPTASHGAPPPRAAAEGRAAPGAAEAARATGGATDADAAGHQPGASGDAHRTAPQSAPHSAAPAAAGAPAIPESLVLLTLPNILTALRCLAVLVIVILIAWPFGPLLTGALVVFGLAAATDWADGALARAWGVTSDLGRMLDHVADKLLVGITMLMLCSVGIIDGVNVIAAALILGREIAISGLREHLGARGIVVPASLFAKWKTTFQMVALAALMAVPLAPLEVVARVTALLILWAAMVMTIISGAQYIVGTRQAWSGR